MDVMDNHENTSAKSETTKWLLRLLLHHFSGNTNCFVVCTLFDGLMYVRCPLPVIIFNDSHLSFCFFSAIGAEPAKPEGPWSATDRVGGLQEWLDQGGACPQWRHYQLCAAGLWQRSCRRQACLSVATRRCSVSNERRFFFLLVPQKSLLGRALTGLPTLAV